MKTHVGGEAAWSAITRAVARSRGTVYAAIGYVGMAAPDILPLKRGDVLICDASPGTVAAGATRPEPLATYLRRGVEVWSLEGLHAKTIVLPGRAFVGSANASATSRDDLVEVVVESTDTATRRELRLWMDRLPAIQLDGGDIRRLSSLAPKPVRSGPTKPAVGSLPSPLTQLRIYSDVVSEYWTAASERAYESQTPGVRRKGKAVASGAHLDTIEMRAWDLSRLPDRTWLSYVLDGEHLHAPAVVVHKSAPVRGWGLLWLARPPTTQQSIAWDRGRALLHKLRQSPDRRIFDLKGRDAERIASLFR